MFVVFIVIVASLSTSVTIFGKENASRVRLCVGQFVFRGLPFERFGSPSSGVDEGGRLDGRKRRFVEA